MSAAGLSQRADERGADPAIIHDIPACPFDLANLECRHTAYKESGGKVDGAKRCARNRESENGWSVRVNDRVHIGAGLVDLAMDEAFLVQLSILPADWIGVQVELQYVCPSH